MTRVFYLGDLIVYFVVLDEDVKMKNVFDEQYFPRKKNRIQRNILIEKVTVYSEIEFTLIESWSKMELLDILSILRKHS